MTVGASAASTSAVAADAPRVDCLHCGLSLPAVGAVEDRFCCHACAAVFHAVQDAGLGAWYDLREPTTIPTPAASDPVPPDDVWNDVAHPAPDDETRREARVYVDGMHCAACVWLTERVVGGVPGVVAAETSLASRHMRLRWDPGTVDLPDLARELSRFGYRMLPVGDETERDARRRRSRDLLARLGVAGALAGNIMLLAFPFYLGEPEPEAARWFRGLQGILATLLLLYPADLFRKGAVAALRARRLSVDQPLWLGVFLAWCGSMAALFRGDELWFDSLGALVFLLLCARALERFARDRALERLSRRGRVEITAHLLHDDDARSDVPASSLARGNRIVLGLGDRVPADAELIEGRLELDESALTGEPLPVRRLPGEELLGSALVASGTGVARVLRPAAEGMVARLSDRVDRAVAARTPALERADRLAGLFTAVILSASALTAVGWWLTDPSRALTAVVAVLVVSCPCALALAAPAVYVGGLASAARLGALFRDGRALEETARVDRVVFDKTGTLTLGRPDVGSFEPHSGTEPPLDPGRALDLAASLEMGSTHPIGRALWLSWTENGGARPMAQEVEEAPGRGVRGRIDGRELRVGSAEFCGAPAIPEELPDDPGRTSTRVHLSLDGRYRGSFPVMDRPRADAAAAVARLHAQGLRTHLATGDASPAARRLGLELGLGDVRTGMSPERKAAMVRGLSAVGSRVLFIGDGVNDGPALAEAGVGFAVGEASELARGAAHALLLSPRIGAVPDLIDLGRRVRRSMRRNLVLALSYNVVVIPLAMTGHIGPLAAALLMPLSSTCVVLSALWGTRLPRRRSGPDAAP